MSTTFILSITFALYFLLVMLVSFYASRRTRNLSDYILAGRHLSGPLVALGAGASDMSSWLLMALPGTVFLHGLNQIWLPLGLVIGAYFNWKFVAARLRVYTERAGNALTLPAYFAGRFPSHAKILRGTTAIIVLVFFTGYTAAGFVAGADLAHLIFPISYTTGLLITAGFIVSYTLIGGFFAISWLDMFQGSLMFLALLIVPYYTFHTMPISSADVGNLISHIDGYLNPLNAFSWISVMSLLAWGLGYFGQPHILVRFMAARSANEIPVARMICLFWMSVALAGAVLTGIVGRAYLGHLANPETVFIRLSYLLFNPWVAGILISAVLSAIMSSSSAQLLASSSALIEDIYHTFVRRKASSLELMLGARLAVFIIAVCALTLALNPKGSILHLVAYAWAGLGASFGPVILLSLFWRRITPQGASLGMIAAAAVVIIWEILGNHYQGIFNLYSMFPAFCVNSFVIIIVSLIYPKHAKITEAMFLEVQKTSPIR
jgi:sodium/proline symporter